MSLRWAGPPLPPLSSASCTPTVSGNVCLCLHSFPFFPPFCSRGFVAFAFFLVLLFLVWVRAAKLTKVSNEFNMKGNQVNCPARQQTFPLCWCRFSSTPSCLLVSFLFLFLFEISSQHSAPFLRDVFFLLPTLNSTRNIIILEFNFCAQTHGESFSLVLFAPIQRPGRPRDDRDDYLRFVFNLFQITKRVCTGVLEWDADKKWQGLRWVNKLLQKASFRVVGKSRAGKIARRNSCR